MSLPNVTRTKTEIIKNNLPDVFLGMPFGRVFGYDLTIVPPRIENNIMLDPKPKMMILNENKEELFCFQTSTVFKFENNLPKEDTYRLIYNLIMVAVDEFNLELIKVENNLTIGRQFKKDTFENLYDDIGMSLMMNNVN